MKSDIRQEVSQLNKIVHLEDPLSIKKQIQLVERISQYPVGLTQLLELLIDRRSKDIKSPQCIDGVIFKYLRNSKIIALENKIHEHFREGIVKLESSNDIDYRPLYESLISNNFKAANRLTQEHLSALAGLNNSQKRQWLYFTDVTNLPAKDLKTINKLWTIYSGGRFGFSVQKEVWIYNNRNWEKFWHKIGWKINKQNTRYPNEFTWDTTAPVGHLPLFNQLRGVQVLAALFMHPALKKET